jgi:hypothetical protein
MIRIGIARVSTKNQQCSGNSLTEQVQRLKQYDSTMPIYEFAQSAYNKSIFPQIRKMLKPNIEIVVLYCDRLSRKIAHCTEFITKELEPINGHVYAIADKIRTDTKEGTFEFYKKIMEGETLSHNIGIRVKDGLKHRKKPISHKYGENAYEKNNIRIIMEFYHSKTKVKDILEYFNANKIKRCENDTKNTWTTNKINIIIKENKKKQEYKNIFLFSDFKKELTAITNNKRKNETLLNSKNKKNKINVPEPDEEYECFVDCSSNFERKNNLNPYNNVRDNDNESDNDMDLD